MKRLEAWIVAGAALSIALVLSLERPAISQTDDTGCAPGFARIVHPHGTQMDFSCRTRVLTCPEQSDYLVSIIPERALELQSGVQYTYQCRYSPRRS